MKRVFWMGLCVGLCGVMLQAAPKAKAKGTQAAKADPRLTAAKKFVDSSPRYLHHSQLKRGMKGYGLTVFAGVKIERFEVTIVSVIKNFQPGIDAILATCKGHGLEQSQVAAGMSGSPVYMKDPADGKYKMIGATAFGWNGSLNAVFGIQPITQMLALKGMLPGETLVEKPAAKSSARKKPAGKKAVLPPDSDFSRERFYRLLREYANKDRLKPAAVKAATPKRPEGLTWLRTPLVLSGLGSKSIGRVRQILAPRGLVPMAGAGGAGGVDAKGLAAVKLAPGSTLAIPYVTGDADWVGIGTVTDVLPGGKVIGFGHSMDAAGKVDFPMCTGYIHTIIPTRFDSFKLGSTIRPVGTLTRDEQTGVGGQVGMTARMIPMTVRVNQLDDKRSRTYKFKLIDNWQYTPYFASSLLSTAMGALRNPPEHHYFRYDFRVTFEDLGTYHASNISTSSWELSSDLTNPLEAVMANPFAKPPKLLRIDATVTIVPEVIDARIVQAKLDKSTVKPGELVRGHLLIEQYRKPRRKLPFSIRIPKTMPDGTYPLTVGGLQVALYALRDEQPQTFTPRTIKAIFALTQAIATPRNDRLYLHLPLPASAGLTLGDKPLDSLPSSKAGPILQADLPETQHTSKSILTSQPIDVILGYPTTLYVTVRKQTNEQPAR